MEIGPGSQSTVLRDAVEMHAVHCKTASPTKSPICRGRALSGAAMLSGCKTFTQQHEEDTMATAFGINNLLG